MRRWLIVAAGLNGLAAVTAGAAAQHLWGNTAGSAQLAETAVRYGLPHAVVLLVLGALPTPGAGKLARGLARGRRREPGAWRDAVCRRALRRCRQARAAQVVTFVVPVRRQPG